MVYLIYQGLEPSLAFKIMESVRKGKGLTPEFEEEMIKMVFRTGILILVKRLSICSLKPMRLLMY